MLLVDVTVQQLLSLARTGLAIAFLFYASWSDNRTREVSNNVWAVFAPVALVLTFIEVYLYQFSQLPVYGVCFGLTALFSVVVFYAGGFGGADAKALMCLALALPFYPVNLVTPLSGTISPISRNLFPLSVFTNSVLMAALMTLVMLGYNTLWRVRTGKKLFEGGKYENESIGRKALVLITGYKVSVQKLKEKWHLYPLEDANEDSESNLKRKLVTLPKDEERDAIVARLDKAVKNGKIQNGVWATPGLPFLVFVTAGLVLALFVGDIVWICIRFALG
jgi:preflagellin peptidase FlaK